jgi:hypothetical protein
MCGRSLTVSDLPVDQREQNCWLLPKFRRVHATGFQALPPKQHQIQRKQTLVTRRPQLR